jgi:hypothetical protein
MAVIHIFQLAPGSTSRVRYLSSGAPKRGCAKDSAKPHGGDHVCASAKVDLDLPGVSNQLVVLSRDDTIGVFAPQQAEMMAT